MARPKLLVHPRHSPGGLRHKITPKSAGWKYVGFESREINKGKRNALKTGLREICVVILTGKARVTTKDFDSGIIGEREDVFSGLPWSVYVPPHHNVVIEAAEDCEVAICSSPAVGKFPARVIPPSDVETLTRGKETNERFIRNILSETAPAESLLVVEVITPAGHWSSYPPHKHDRDEPPAETLLEETYYHRLSPHQGFALQRIYTEDRSIDETLAVSDRDVVLVPRGYHPVSAAHGYDLYYLNVMAGPKRMWRFHNDPAHEWLLA